MALKISIITPSFNQGKFIEQTIQSVLSQNYPDLEYIIMDGGSTDETVSILKKYEGKLKWFSEKDKGQSGAINKGLKMITGDIIAWINSDDYYLPGTLTNIAELFEKNKNIQWITGDYIVVDAKGKEIHAFVRLYKKLVSYFSSFAALSFANYINQPSTFWKKELQDKAGRINESYRYCMDYDLWLRFMKVSAPYIIHTPLSAFRIHATSKGGSEYGKQFEEELEVVQKYTNNQLVVLLHKCHNMFINIAYKIIK
ncbi:glycosyltransferase [Candidatus Roizmanbacteria bacterium CG_4_10_14_0_8_um_filter_39_9]|uniref:Glycosyltransferase n=1 Tax=Candidatus Roizmanbacteria bacterium CG_4_10_14_0_8_um_filter_39_9 TaxID=1974829 RepID=A0A2M7QEE8_9BACT|nr:MAG: glycosyltransferase [Candidatus Roizmanbacteria bacterium CG_4_10_14_0_8_um_filter_39_9]